MVHRPACAAVLFLLVVSGVHADEAFRSRGGTFYLLRVDPHGETPGKPGWGLGAEGAWNFLAMPRFLTLELGIDGGNLESDDRTSPDADVLTASHDYFRVFGGIAASVDGLSRLQPHAAVHLALVRQDARLLRFDPTFGEFEEVESDSHSGVGYDVAGGVALRLSRRMRLDGGVRYMAAPQIEVQEEFGTSTRPRFALIYLGLGIGRDG